MLESKFCPTAQPRLGHRSLHLTAGLMVQQCEWMGCLQGLVLLRNLKFTFGCFGKERPKTKFQGSTVFFKQ